MKHTLFAFVFVLWSSTALAWSPFPVLEKGAHYAGEGPWRSMPTVEACLKTLSEASDADYYAAIVNNTSLTDREADHDAVPYVDALHHAWSLRPDRDILIVLGLANRSVAIHPGSEWVRIGFQTTSITATIDGSNFKSLAGSQDYAGALCHLAETVEQKLTMLKASEEDVLERARAEGAAQRAVVDELEQRVSTAEVTLREVLTSDVRQANAALDALNFALGQKNVAMVNASLARARAAVTHLQRVFDSIDEISKITPEIKADIEALVTDINSAEYNQSRKAALASQAHDCILKIPTPVQVGLGAVDLNAARVCVEATRQAHESAIAGWRMQYRTIPGLMFVSLLVGLLVACAVFASRRRSAKRMAKAEIDVWRDKLGQASARILALESEFAGYLSKGDVRYTGQTSVLDVKAANEVNLVFLMFDQATNLLKEAESMFAAVPVYSAAGFDQCVEQLTSTPVKIDLGIPATELRVFSPLTQSYAGNASGVLDELDKRYAEAYRLLAELQAAVDQALASSAEVRKVADEVDEAIRVRSTLGFPTKRHLESLRELEATIASFQHEVLGDPMAANEHDEALLSEVRGLLDLVRLGNDAVAYLENIITPKAQALRAQIAELRGSGWALMEPGFDPNAVLDQASFAARELREAVAAFDEARAERIRVELDAIVDKARDRVAVSIDARKSVPARLERMAQRRDRIERAIPAAREALSRITQEYAPAAYQVESDNLDQLANVLVDISDTFLRIKQYHAQQRYLAAVADVENCESIIATANDLIDEIHAAETLLADLKREAKDLRRKCEAMVQELSQRSENLGVGAARRTQIFEIGSEAKALFSQFNTEKPNWRKLHERASDLHARIEALLNSVETGRSCYERAVGEMEATAKLLKKVAAEVQSERRDRPHIANTIADTQARFDVWRKTAVDPEIEGESLLDQVMDFQEQAAEAQQMWVRERTLIEDATRELGLASDQYRRVSKEYYGYGISPQLNDGLASIHAAEQAVETLQWEEVLRASQLAIRQIRAEDTSCRRESNRIAAVRRRAAEAAAAVAATSTHTSSSSSWSSSSSSFSSSSSSFSSSSSGGSSFSSSSSGGSSFGGSSSGGSSW